MDDMAAVFEALGSAPRRKILDIVKANPGCSVGEVAAEFDTTRIAVLHHLRQLEDCDLIVSTKEGRIRHLYHNPVPIQLIYDRWTNEYGGFWASKMADVKYAVEGKQRKRDKTPGATHGRDRQAGIEDRDQRKHRGRVA
jgi:predicted transcriptional regulator